MPDMEEMFRQVEERKRVLEHLMKSLEAWRASTRIAAADTSVATNEALSKEERELMHAYDLLHKLIGKIQSSNPGSVVDIQA